MPKNISDNFSLAKSLPLDRRSTISSISDISKISYPYVGLIFYCEDTKTHYKVTETSVVKSGPFNVLKITSYSPIVSTAITEDYTMFKVTADEVGTEDRFAILSSFEVTKSNVVIEWGDGTQEKLSENESKSEFDEKGNFYVYKASHTYANTGSYNVKIFGNDYFSISRNKKYTYPSDLLNTENAETARGLLSECFTNEFPVASCVKNLDYFAAYSSRLTEVTITEDFSSFQSSKYVFRTCKNLTTLNNAKKLISNNIEGLLYNCSSLTQTDFRLPSFGEYNSYDYVFYNCSSLNNDINDLMPENGFDNGIKSFNSTFTNCSSLTGTVNDKLFWNNPNVQWEKSENSFTGSSQENYSIKEFGGTLNNQYVYEYKGQIKPITETVQIDSNNYQLIINPRVNSKYLLKGEGIVNITTEEFKLGDSFELIYDSSSITINFPEEWINYNSEAMNTEKGYYNLIIEKVGVDEQNYKVYYSIKQNKNAVINSDRIVVDKVDENNNIVIESKNLPIAIKTNKGSIYPIERGTITEKLVSETVVVTKIKETTLENGTTELSEVQEEIIVEKNKFFIDIDTYLIYDNQKEFEGEWIVFIASGIQGNKGKDAISFAQPVITTLASDAEATATSTIDENGVVTLNLGIPKGDKGENAISVSENVQVTSLMNGQEATVAVEFDNGVASFAFGIPEGKKGNDAISFAQPVITTLASDKEATASSTIDENGVVTLNLGIPKGDKGENAISVSENVQVTTLESTEEATAGVSFNNGEVNFELGIPKGKPAGFGEINAEVSQTLEPTEEATVELTTSGTNEAKTFHFDFKIPRGKDAFSFNQKVDVVTLNYNDSAYAETTISEDNEVTLKLGIPQAQLYSTEIDQNGFWVVNGVKTEYLAQVMGSNIVYANNIPENPVEGTVFIQADKNEDEKYLNVTKLVVVNDEPEGEIANGTILI